jgi:hypothetical protein
LEGLKRREGPMMEERVEPLQEQKLREAVRTTASPQRQRLPVNWLLGVSARVRDSSKLLPRATFHLVDQACFACE